MDEHPECIAPDGVDEGAPQEGGLGGQRLTETRTNCCFNIPKKKAHIFCRRCLPVDGDCDSKYQMSISLIVCCCLNLLSSVSNLFRYFFLFNQLVFWKEIRRDGVNIEFGGAQTWEHIVGFIQYVYFFFSPFSSSAFSQSSAVCVFLPSRNLRWGVPLFVPVCRFCLVGLHYCPYFCFCFACVCMCD